MANDEIHNVKFQDPSSIERNNNCSNLNDENSKKTINQTSITQNNTNSINDQVITSQYDGTSELAESVNVSSNSTINHHNNKSSTKTNRKSHKHGVQDHSSNENNRQRSLSSSSSTSSTSTNSSTSNDNQISNIPYETLHNDDDDNDDNNISEHTNKTTNQISS